MVHLLLKDSLNTTCLPLFGVKSGTNKGRLVNVTLISVAIAVKILFVYHLFSLSIESLGF